MKQLYLYEELFRPLLAEPDLERTPVTIEYNPEYEGHYCIQRSEHSGCSIGYFLRQLSYIPQNRPLLNHIKRHYPEFLI